MARSQYIYVVIDRALATVPIATYTVKHEMVTDLKKVYKDGLRDSVVIIRYGDGCLCNCERLKAVITNQIKEEMK